MKGEVVVFTGGGTAGHVLPNLVIADQLSRQQPTVRLHYIGQVRGVEQQIAEGAGFEFHGIPAGKLRRYLSVKNLFDVFRVLAGTFRAWRLMGRLRPAAVFSKGGYVAFPVVLAAALRRVPVAAHESDLTPGLTTRLCMPFVTHLLTAFPETKAALADERSEYVGMPLRSELFVADSRTALEHCGFVEQDTRPILLAMGGSLGADSINQAVRTALDELLIRYRVVHLTGPGRLAPDIQRDGYAQFEFVSEWLGSLLALSDVVVSRAGATALFELIALRRPHVLVPLSLAASRGDQIENARLAEGAGMSVVLNEEDLAAPALLSAIDRALDERSERQAAMRAWLPEQDAGARCAALLKGMMAG